MSSPQQLNTENDTGQQAPQAGPSTEGPRSPRPYRLTVDGRLELATPAAGDSLPFEPYVDAPAVSPKLLTEAEVEEECGICFEPFTTLCSLRPCKHRFDYDCIDPWLNSLYERAEGWRPDLMTCPMCRGIIETVVRTNPTVVIDIAFHFRRRGRAVPVSTNPSLPFSNNYIDNRRYFLELPFQDVEAEPTDHGTRELGSRLYGTRLRRNALQEGHRSRFHRLEMDLRDHLLDELEENIFAMRDGGQHVRSRNSRGEERLLYHAPAESSNRTSLVDPGRRRRAMALAQEIAATGRRVRERNSIPRLQHNTRAGRRRMRNGVWE